MDAHDGKIDKVQQFMIKFHSCAGGKENLNKLADKLRVSVVVP